MASNSSSITPCIQPNPDISGIGVRVSIYAQAFLSLVNLIIFAMDGKITIEEGLAINDIVMTNEITAFALLVSAIIQARTYGLTTYHANIVLILSWIAFVPTAASVAIMALGAVTNRKLTWQLPLRGLVIWLHYVAVAGLGIWVWSDVKKFGSETGCTPQTFVVIFDNIPVTNQVLRGFSLYIYGSIALGAAIILIVGPVTIYRRLRHRGRLGAPERTESPADTNSHAELRGQKSNKKWLIALILALVMEICLVANTEVLIRRSKGLVFPGESLWTFGQSLAVLLILIPFVSTIGQLQEGIIWDTRVFSCIHRNRGIIVQTASTA